MKNYISNLRNISTVMVIIIHTVADYIRFYNITDLNLWQISNFINSMVRFCVPIFFMISGATLLGKDEDLIVFISKRFKRILLPFIFWVTIYFFIYLEFNLLSFIDILKIFLENLFRGAQYSYHFWFIYTLLGLYLFLPILRKWILNSSKYNVIYFIVIWGVTLLINYKTQKYFPAIDLSYFSGSIGYLVLGYFIDKYVSNYNKYNLYTSMIFILIGFMSTFFLSEFYSIKNNKFENFFYDYLSPNIALYSIGIFMLFKFKFNKVFKIGQFLDKNSYGIYLIHVFILNIVEIVFKTFNIFIIDKPLYFIFYIICVSFLTYSISLLIINTLSKIKILKSFIT